MAGFITLGKIFMFRKVEVLQKLVNIRFMCKSVGLIEIKSLQLILDYACMHAFA